MQNRCSLGDWEETGGPSPSLRALSLHLHVCILLLPSQPGLGVDLREGGGRQEGGFEAFRLLGRTRMSRAGQISLNMGPNAGKISPEVGEWQWCVFVAVICCLTGRWLFPLLFSGGRGKASLPFPHHWLFHPFLQGRLVHAGVLARGHILARDPGMGLGSAGRPLS